MNNVLMVTQNKLARNYHETIGRLPRLLRARGYDVIWSCPREGDPLPENVELLAGVYFDGASVSSNKSDEYEWMRAQLRFMERCLAHAVPMLTVCMASGLLSHVLGAPVARHPSGLGERGYRPITPTAAGAHLFPDPLNAYFWHQDGFGLPSGAVLLAASNLFNQAYCYKNNVYALQFHPEWTPEIIRRYALMFEPETLNFPGADDENTQRREGKLFDGDVEHWLQGFLGLWPSPHVSVPSMREHL